MFRTGVQMSLLVLLAGCLLFWLSQAGPLREFDDAAGSRIAQIEARLRQLAFDYELTYKRAQSSTVLVAINDSSATDHPWPWSPLDYSLFVQGALNFNSQVLVTNEVLDWDYANLDPGDRQKLPQYEKILRDSLRRAPKMLLGSELGWPEDPNTIPPVQEAPLLRHVKGDLRFVPEWTVIERQPKEEFRLAATIGFTNVPDRNHTLHSTPLVLRYQGRVVPTLPLQAILLWLKLSPDDVEVVLGSHLFVGPKLRVPIDEAGRMRVNFATPVTVIGFDDLLLASEQIAAKQKTRVPVEQLAKSVAFLARTDKGASQLALGRGRPGTAGELFAAAIATMQSQAFLHRVSLWMDASLLLVAVLFAGWVPIWKKRKVAGWCLALIVVYTFLAFLLFAMYDLLLPVALPLGLLLFIALYRLATPDHVWKLRRPVIL